MKTSELTGAALDWAVAKAQGRTDVTIRRGMCGITGWTGGDYNGHNTWTGWYPSTNWAQGGPISEREKIDTHWDDGVWYAKHPSIRPRSRSYRTGPTELIAKMRCYVASKLGDEVDVPEELLK